MILILLIVLLIPGREAVDLDGSAQSDLTGGGVALGGQSGTTGAEDGGGTGGGPGTVVAGGGDAGGGAAAPQGQPGSVTFDEAKKKGLKLDFGPACDPKTGRIRVPSVYAPPCVVPHSGPNGGKTHVGVTAKEIKVVLYQGEVNAATQALLTAAGADDSATEQEQTYNDYAKYFQAHYETYGRKVKVITVQGGEDDDEVAAKKNGIKVAKEIRPFASWGGPASTNAYVDELVKEKILCFCTASQPIETYLQREPYVWSTLMSSTQLYTHRAEYVGKRLWKAGKKAKYAGDATYQLRDRTFALVYFETAEKAYKAGADFFEKELKKYGAKLSLRIPVTGAHLDPAGAQEEAPSVATKLAGFDNGLGITSVLFAGDPLYPIFLTKEATKQNYFPEWIVTGSVLSDTSFFGRTYDQAQWANAFGLSALSAGLPEELTESFRLHQWHHGSGPVANDTHGVLFPNPWLFFTGVHMAGPVLNPQTFRAGMFAYPPSGGGPVHQLSSFGTWYWPFRDYLRLDTTAELWWDSVAAGEDETGGQGVGLYRYVAGGKRYLPGTWPTKTPNVFTEAGTVTIYDTYPKGDAPPSYAHKHY